MSVHENRTGAEIGAAAAAVRPHGGVAVRYPDAYCWIVLLATLDIVCTWIVLHSGGREVNGIAQRAIEAWGHWGLIALKFSTLVVVLGICEFVAARRPDTGRRLVRAAIVLSALPVAVGMAQLAAHAAL